MRERIHSEIRRLAAADGGHAPGRRAFERKTGIGMHAWYGLWHLYRWGDKVKMLKPEALGALVDDHRRADFLGMP